MTIALEEVAQTLRNHAERLREELSNTERAIDLLAAPIGIPVIIASPPPVEDVGDDPGPGAPSRRRRFTDEQKADIVDRGKELGSIASAAREAGIPRAMIDRWKREGFGN